MGLNMEKNIQNYKKEYVDVIGTMLLLAVFMSFVVVIFFLFYSLIGII